VAKLQLRDKAHHSPHVESSPYLARRAWHADHIDKQDSNAMECFPLIALLVFNIFHAFLILNLRPVIRRGRTWASWPRLMLREIYAGIRQFRSP